MRVGLATSMNRDWYREFERACLAVGHEVVPVCIGADDWMSQVEGLGSMMWHLTMGNHSMMAEARAKIPLIEEAGIPCYPSARMLWLFDDKIRETFFMRRHGYPMPRTFVSFDEADARRYAASAAYPLVTKTHMGASSSGVMLLRSAREADRLIDRIFTKQSFADKALVKFYYQPRLRSGDFLLNRHYRHRGVCPKYAYFQEFVETPNDWRITTFGTDIVSAFVRRNRPGDFRASGSGLWQHVSEDELPRDACDLARRVSTTHSLAVMTYDFMEGPSGWVIGEMSYGFILNAVYSDSLFRATAGGYVKEPSTTIGELHLMAMESMPLKSTEHGAGPSTR